MSCFSLYGINFYDEALDCIERFTNTYPSDKKLIYAEYLKAVIFFEQMRIKILDMVIIEFTNPH